MVALKQILVATDFGEPARVALEYGRELAAAFGATLHLVHVVDDVSARAMGLKASTVLAENTGGRVADALIAEAKRWHADLIVMGTHGRRGVKRALLGSDAELVIRYSPVPVLLVPGKRR